MCRLWQTWSRHEWGNGQGSTDNAIWGVKFAENCSQWDPGTHQKIGNGCQKNLFTLSKGSRKVQCRGGDLWRGKGEGRGTAHWRAQADSIMGKSSSWIWVEG